MPAPGIERIAPLVYLVRAENVMLDSDLASLYAVEARALNQAVSRNHKRFPPDFMFRLTPAEFEALRPGFLRPAHGGHPSKSLMSSPKHRGSAHLPYAFTERGVAMLSSVLRSPRAIEVNIAIMRTFVELRRLMDFNGELARRIEAMEKKYDERFAAVFDAIKRLIAEDDARKAAPKRRI